MNEDGFASGCDVAVVGGGIVGSAIAYGLASRGLKVTVLDEGDRALRAARTNFGLVWVQSKGDGMPAYMRWTRRSADLWPAFAAELESLTGVGTEYRKDGGLVYCLGEADLAAQGRKIAGLAAQADVFDSEMVDRAALERLQPDARFGPDVAGASYCPHDGHCNPLYLLRALHAGLALRGARYRPAAPVSSIERREGRFVLATA
ncbi:MAG TPA: FAD-dependent oxidoreductase, partial [Usitatibacteraceae bacterium]|nr:FAD-dependent oxidoreductase [Usitatibacteraceae bacterium]